MTARPAATEGEMALVDAGAILNTLPDAALVVGGEGEILYANAAAEQFFDAGAALLIGRPLDSFLPADSPLFPLIAQVRRTGTVVAEYGVTMTGPRIGSRQVTLKVAPLAEAPNAVVLSLHEHSMAEKIDRQLTHRNAVRSVTAMAVMLAHEIRNPLSGIRGAAQLLEQTASDQDRGLTRLICEETDRLGALVDRLEVFSHDGPIARAPVNIHEVLERVRALAERGFARHVRFKEDYDPSLPSAYGNRDLLIQAFLNLVKNSAEAVPETGGEIILSTAYRQGIRMAVPGTENRLHLPLLVTVQDNGSGIAEDLRGHLFDPFVTTKMNGTGLGLSAVAKIVGDHGGVIEFESAPRRTVFRVLLPIGDPRADRTEPPRTTTP